jgi:hypothetical protein
MKVKKQLYKTKTNNYTDLLSRCKTWEEVMSLRDIEEDKWRTKIVLADRDWMSSFSNEDSVWAEDNNKKTIYDDLLDEIELLLEEEDLSIFLLTYQGNGSLRWVADKIGKSHEYTRKRLIEIKSNLQTNLPSRFRTLV